MVAIPKNFHDGKFVKWYFNEYHKALNSKSNFSLEKDGTCTHDMHRPRQHVVQ